MSLSMTAAIAPSQPGQLGEYWITYISIIHCWVDFAVFLPYFYHLPFQYGLVVIRTITDHLWYTYVCMYRYVHHIFGPLITSVDSAAVCVYLCMCVWLCVCVGWREGDNIGERHSDLKLCMFSYSHELNVSATGSAFTIVPHFCPKEDAEKDVLTVSAQWTMNTAIYMNCHLIEWSVLYTVTLNANSGNIHVGCRTWQLRKVKGEGHVTERTVTIS